MKIGNGSVDWKGPGHGGVIQDARGAFYFVYQTINGVANPTAPDKKFGFLQQMYYDRTLHDFYFENGQVKVTMNGVPFP